MISNNQKILIVGGKGFIGSHLVDKLIELGYIDRKKYIHRGISVLDNENVREFKSSKLYLEFNL